MPAIVVAGFGLLRIRIAMAARLMMQVVSVVNGLRYADGMNESRVSVAKAAEIAGRSPGAVRHAIRSGALVAEKFGPRGWYSVSAADLESFIVKSRTDSGDAAGDVAGSDRTEILKAS